MSKFYDAKEDERKSDSSATAPIMPEATTEATEEEIFRRLGSPENHLARSVTGKLESSYYADDQNDFACLSQEILISLIKNNNLRDILKLNQSGVDADEKAGMEAMYKACADGRARITKLTKVPKNAEEVIVQESDMQRLSYRESINMDSTGTPLGGDNANKYRDYLALSRTTPMLKLSSCLKLLDEAVRPEDRSVNLGMMMPNFHMMGKYRDEKNAQKIDRVDEVTILAAKKSIQASDEGKQAAEAGNPELAAQKQDAALKYALTFCVLRGYNLRSEIGACHAQEESARLLFDAIGIEQPKKMPGVYLDIAACCEPMFGGTGRELETLITQQMQDYKASISNPDHKGKFFDKPSPATPEIYQNYLQVTERYKQKEVSPSSLSATPVGQAFGKSAALGAAVINS